MLLPVKLLSVLHLMIFPKHISIDGWRLLVSLQEKINNCEGILQLFQKYLEIVENPNVALR